MLKKFQLYTVQIILIGSVHVKKVSVIYCSDYTNRFCSYAVLFISPRLVSNFGHCALYLKVWARIRPAPCTATSEICCASPS
jgi:hypothetical protein